MLRGSKARSLIQPLLSLAQREGLPAFKLPAALKARVNPGEPIPIGAVFQLWAELASRTRDPTLPLRSAALLRVEDLGVAGLASMTAPSGYDAFERALRYLPLVVSSGVWHSERDDRRVSVRWLRGGERCLGHRLANESGVAQFVTCLRQVYGEPFQLSEVAFRHAAPSSTRAHREHFGCAVTFGHDYDGFSFSVRLLERTPRAANATLARHIQADAEARLLASASPSLASRVRYQLERQLSQADIRLAATDTARALGMSERSLRRQLRFEGTSHRALLASAQRDAAHVLLQHTRLPITEIALRVGFSDSAAFAHACQRWFACSARQLRREELNASGQHLQ
ncbi:MAG: AraC family transcriptional regulator ligand-binding domain-containing protein [Myxococcota bacterium]